MKITVMTTSCKHMEVRRSGYDKCTQAVSHDMTRPEQNAAQESKKRGHGPHDGRRHETKEKKRVEDRRD